MMKWKGSDRRDLRGFTLVEILTVMGVSAVLIAMITAGGQTAIAHARSTQCLSNLRAIGGATMLYAADNEMSLPPTVHGRRFGLASWRKLLPPYAEGELSFRCPCDDKRPVASFSYALNDFLTPDYSNATSTSFRLTRLDRPGSTILFAEAADTMLEDHFHLDSYHGLTIPADVLQAQIAVERHSGSSNYLFTDGHVENIPWKRVQALVKEVPSRLFDPTSGEPTPTPTPYPY